MWLQLIFRPWWVRWLVYSVMSAPLAAGYLLFGNYPDPRHGDRWSSLGWWVGTGIATLVLGLVMSLSMAARREQVHACLCGVGPGDYRQVAKAVAAGPIPADPSIREAAGRLARFQSNGLDKLSRLSRWVCGLGVLLQIPDFVNLNHPPTLSRVLMVITFTALTVYYSLYPRLLDARAQLLSGQPSVKGAS